MAGGRGAPPLRTRWAAQVPACPLNDYPRPQFVRPDWLCLNGSWHYGIAPRGEKPQQLGESILVPFSPETALSGVSRGPGPEEDAWYGRSFTLPEGFWRGRLLLHFGAVDQRCEVLVNGQSAGSHLGGYTPFTMDITAFVQPQAVNRILVCVQDLTENGSESVGKQSSHPGGIWYTAQSGIWQTVWLESVPERYIPSIRITPDPKAETVLLELPDACEGDAFGVLAEGRLVCEGTFQNGRTLVSLPGCRLWSPEDPFLYDLLLRRGEDVVKCYFAMRNLTAENGRLLLNGRPIFLSGLLDQGYWPESLYTPPCDQAMVEDIQTAKSLGFNLLRKHIKVEPLRWYYHCDRLGMLVWQDLPSGGDYSFLWMTLLPNLGVNLPDEPKLRLGRQDNSGCRHFRREAREVFQTLFNSPSVICWSLFNEGWGQFETETFTRRAREWDPTRLIDQASGWFDRKGGDFHSLHAYFLPPRLKADARVQALTEFGGYCLALPEHSAVERGFGYRRCTDGEALMQRLEALYRRQILPLKQLGLCVAIYTQLSDVEGELNGLVTWDRAVCKVDRERLRALNAELTGAERSDT